MLISCCGNRCDECERYPGECPGCAAIGGKAEWCASLDVEVCPFVTCAAETGVSHCGECEEFPCELYELTLSEDAGEEERGPLPWHGTGTSVFWMPSGFWKNSPIESDGSFPVP